MLKTIPTSPAARWLQREQADGERAGLVHDPFGFQPVPAHIATNRQGSGVARARRQRGKAAAK